MAPLTPESSAIRLSAARDGVHVAFTVADDGVGIAPERLPYLFRRFSREEGEERSSVGAGLGLAISRGIVEAHGGRIWAESGGPPAWGPGSPSPCLRWRPPTPCSPPCLRHGADGGSAS